MGKPATATGRRAKTIGWQESALGLLSSIAAFARSAKKKTRVHMGGHAGRMHVTEHCAAQTRPHRL
jgi:hypothetical protein